VKTLELTVLAHEGPQVRAYLGRMRQAGYRPSRILLMVYSQTPASGKPVGRWLPGGLRRRYAERVQDMVQNFWPTRIRRAHPEFVEIMAGEIDRISPGAAELIDEMLGNFAYERYAERVDRVLVRNLRDEALGPTLASRGPGAVLFTGGGILRANLLDQPGLRFLHVHPGFLPRVRGGDGLLWSTLVRGRPGASCFYMAGGIDTGELIATENFPALQFDLGDRARPDRQTLYRALFSFYDPILRAELLVRRVLGAGEDLAALPTETQDPSEGITYHFLHPALQASALARIFRGGTPADAPQ